MSLTQHLDLRGGRVCWLEDDPAILSSEPPAQAVDVAIVGAGVMGAMLAERLTAQGRSVALLDRRPPGRGSTAASTALVMWASDTPLITLAATWGADGAAQRWRRVHAAVLDLDRRVRSLGLDCDWVRRPELYLAGDLLDEAGLQRECAARQAAGLPSIFLSPAALHDAFGLPPRAALRSGDAFAVDPIALTLALLKTAQARGASLTWPADVTEIAPTSQGVQLSTGDGRVIFARQAILASGYEISRRYLPKAFTLGSSFAIATRPGLAPIWHDSALIWEASTPYLYSRATADGRIVIGGADEDFYDPARRDALIPEKTRILEAGARALLGHEGVVADCAWAATFGGSPDGLPAIGPVRDFDGLWLAHGFGGNGVTFASLAAAMLTKEIGGQPDPDLAAFSPYRFG